MPKKSRHKKLNHLKQGGTFTLSHCEKNMKTFTFLVAFVVCCMAPHQPTYASPPASEKQCPLSVELYYAPYCPHSQRVLDYLKGQKITVTLVDVSKSDEAKKNLGEKGGNMLVPCLFVDGKPLYDDDEIIKWIDSNRACLKEIAPR
jgi:glutaredoxin 3